MISSKLTTLFLFLALSAVIYSQPLAPVMDVPDNPNNDPDITIATAFIKAVVVPDQKDVGVSAYPGSEILQTNKAQDPMLASVRLISSDEVSKVFEYYKKELQDWNYENFFGMHIFWKGDKNEAMAMSAPVVQIEEATLWMNIEPDAKTTVLIGYK